MKTLVLAVCAAVVQFVMPTVVCPALGFRI